MDENNNNRQTRDKTGSLEIIDDDDHQIGDDCEEEPLRKKRQSQSEKLEIEISVRKLFKFAKQKHYSERVGQGVPVFSAGVLEFLATEFLTLSAHEAKNDCGRNGKVVIKPRHVMMAVQKDEELRRMMKGCTFYQTGVLPTFQDNNNGKKKKKGVEFDSESDVEFGS